MSRHTEKPVKLVYSHPIKQRKEYLKDVYKDKIFQPKVNDDGVLEKTVDLLGEPKRAGDVYVWRIDEGK